MQIIRLKISDYKCLKDFSIDFTTDYEKGYSTTVLIGENGSGKSSIIEAIILILMSYDSFDVERQVNFSYELEYMIGGSLYKLEYEAETGKYRALIEEKHNMIISRLHRSATGLRRSLERDGIKLFPLNLITYYSGTDERLNRLNRQRDRVYARSIHSFLKYHTSINASERVRISYPEKKYWYYSKEITIPIMLALLLSNNEYAHKIRSKLNISEIDSFQIEINLRRVLRYTGTIIPAKKSLQMEKFWNVLDALDSRICHNLAKSDVLLTGDYLIIHVTDFSDWHNDGYSILDFFEKLHLIFNVDYDLKINIAAQVVDFFDLSEGQRQLANALGLLTICQNQDSLVLMDEPDVYLNPKWKYDYLNYLEDSIQGATNTQILISTHDPLMINGLAKEYIRKLELEKISDVFKTVVYYPVEETRGLGIDGLLQSGYYGLKTSYDSETSRKYEMRAELFSKLINNELTYEEGIKLTELTKQLNGLPAMNTSIDYLYDDFMREYRNSEYYLEEYLTSEQVKERNKYIAELIEKFFKNKG